MEDEIAKDMLLVSSKIGYRPDFSRLSGTIDVARLEKVASAVVAEVLSDKSAHQAMQIINHAGRGRIRVEKLGGIAEKLIERAENEGVKNLPSVPALHSLGWVGQASRDL